MNFLQALFPALRDVLTPRILVIALLPALLWSVALVGLGWWSWDALMHWLQEPLLQLDLPSWVLTLGRWMAPLLLMWLTLPLMVLGALLVANFTVTPAVVRHLARRDYADVAPRGETGFWQSLGWAAKQLVWALLLWLLTLPLIFLPPLGWLAHVLLWGWLSYRLLAWDALEMHATRLERQMLLQRHRRELWAIGLVVGVATSVPIVLWFLSPLALLLSPLVAFISIWLQLQLFVFVSLWLAHFLLQALRALRTEPIQASA